MLVIRLLWGLWEEYVGPSVKAYIKVSLHTFDKTYLNSDSLIDTDVQR